MKSAPYTVSIPESSPSCGLQQNLLIVLIGDILEGYDKNLYNNSLEDSERLLGHKVISVLNENSEERDGKIYFKDDRNTWRLLMECVNHLEEYNKELENEMVEEDLANVVHGFVD